MREDENDVTVLLPKLRLEIDNLKKHQTVGANNLLIFDNQTADAYDQSVTLNQGDVTERTITFTADNLNFAFTELVPIIYFDSVGSAMDIPYPGFVKIRQHAVNTGIPKQSVFSLVLESNAIGTHTYYFKFHILSVDTGTIS